MIIFWSINRPKESWFASGASSHDIVARSVFLMTGCWILTGGASVIFSNTIPVSPAIVLIFNAGTVVVVVIIIVTVVVVVWLVCTGVVEDHRFQFGHLLG